MGSASVFYPDVTGVQALDLPRDTRSWPWVLVSQAIENKPEPVLASPLSRLEFAPREPRAGGFIARNRQGAGS